MESISDYQLDKYEQILQQIESEKKNYEIIKRQNEDLLDKLQILKILSKADVIRDKLFQFKVKLFNSTYEIYDIFPEALPIGQLTLLSQYENCVYYFIEIFVSQTFHEKIVAQKWTLNISISNSQMRCNKSVSLKNRVLNPITAVLPFINSYENSLVEIYLVSFFEYNCNSIKLASITIDASYRFKEDKRDTIKTIYDDLSRLHSYYNPDTEVTLKEFGKYITYKSTCNWSQEKLLEVILKNCYHNLDPSKILNKTDEGLSLAFLLDGVKSSVVLKTKSLEILSNIYGMQFLKQYLFKNSNEFVSEDFSSILPLSYVKAIVKEVSEEKEKGDIDNLSEIFEKYLKYISLYPI